MAGLFSFKNKNQLSKAVYKYFHIKQVLIKRATKKKKHDGFNNIRENY